MASPSFVDHVKIICRSGKGGAGSSHFRREKFVPKGGPDGGDGGRGGHIVLRGSRHRWTLLHLKYQKHQFAPNGEPGGKQQSQGKQGDDIVLEVPVGTIVRNAETNEQVLEILEDGEEKILLEGGRGGLGNAHFKSATNQAPQYAQPGEAGIEQAFVFELKLLADVGLVGFPNAGKSTLISVLSAAKPKIADYPFTTLTPSLGVVEYRDFQSFVMADIPGIIEGAAEGKGLGTRFLRHIERNAILLFVVPADAPDIGEAYRVLLNELRQFNPELLDKQRLVAISKSDLLDQELQQLTEEALDLPVPYVFISSVAQKGLQALKDQLWNMLQHETQTKHG